MDRAIELALNAQGFTSPNPIVGAVIVKGDEIVAEGFHQGAGSDHAEILAMKELMLKSRVSTVDLDPSLFKNATLYITLEPCCHEGLTPPCSKAIEMARFKKLVVGMKDPNKKVNGKSLKELRKSGIEVELVRSNSEMGKKVRSLNQSFIKVHEIGLPYVTLKAGMSLDGKITSSSGASKWITSSASRKNAKYERSICDAVLVGSKTVLTDNPKLSVAKEFSSKKLLRVIIDKDLSTSLDSKVYRDENVFVATTGLANKSNLKKFKDAGIRVDSFGSKVVDIEKLLKFLLKEFKVQSLFVEGGSSTHGYFNDQNLKKDNIVDRYLLYTAPIILGGTDSLPVIGGVGAKSISHAINFDEVNIDLIGKDLKIDARVKVY